MNFMISFLFPKGMQTDFSPLPKHPRGFLPLLNNLENVRMTRPGDTGSAIVQTFSGEAVFLGFFQSEFELSVHMELQAGKDCCWFVFPIWADPVWIFGSPPVAYESQSYEQQGFFVPAGRYQMYLPSGRNWFYCIAVGGKYMEGVLNEFKGLADLKKVNDDGSRYPLTSCPLPRYTVELLHDFGDNTYTDLSLLLLVKKTIFSVLKRYDRSLVNLLKPKVKESEVVYNKAISYIRNHYKDENLTPERVAGEICVSARKLNRAFQHRSLKVTNFISLMRLIWARELLDTTDIPWQDIAYQVHYNDKYYFAQAYKDQFGVHPKYGSGHPGDGNVN